MSCFLVHESSYIRCFANYGAFRSLDVDIKAKVRTVVEESYRKRTVIEITHDTDDIRDFDKVIWMQDGRVAQFDSPEALLADEESGFRAFFEGKTS